MQGLWLMLTPIAIPMKITTTIQQRFLGGNPIENLHSVNSEAISISLPGRGYKNLSSQKTPRLAIV